MKISFRIKTLYRFMLKSFVPLFAMTFFICLFIVLMQFLWRYIDDLVGKGLGVDVVAELFFYAALSLVPMALPLAILLASLMIFGNLGERFELTAMKASGVSLLKSMSPLIVLIVLIAIGAFFFQNNVLPVAQTKMWTLLFSVKQKSPELEINEGVFNDQIPGYNIYVREVDRNGGMMHSMMIYDMSKGFDNARIILADSGKMSTTEDKTHLVLNLYSGESFENLREAAASVNNVPYGRESFDTKKILLKFDANFSRMEEDGMRNQYVGKNMAELQHTIDSVNARVDSVGTSYANMVASRSFIGVSPYKNWGEDGPRQLKKVQMSRPVNVDSVFHGMSSASELNNLDRALSQLRRQKQDYEFKGLTIADDRKTIVRHGIEMHKKFTLSIACLVFFFIGAPLGAIIRKGGLGMPLVISVLLFIVYYIIDNTGNKLARDQRLAVWEGMWLSTAVLLPLGIFVTYKAVNDSAVFNKDAYMNFFRKLLGRGQVRHLEMKELILDEVEPSVAVEKLEDLTTRAKEFLALTPASMTYTRYWLSGVSPEAVHSLASAEEDLVAYLSNSRNKLVINKLMDLPILKKLWDYHPAPEKWIAWAGIILFPLGIPLWLIGRSSIKALRAEVERIIRINRELSQIISREQTIE